MGETMNNQHTPADAAEQDTLRGALPAADENQTQLERERQFLEVLCKDYTTVYYLNLSADLMEPLKINQASNVARMSGVQTRQTARYSDQMRIYCGRYVIPDEQQRFLKVMTPQNLSAELLHKERFVYRYRTNPNEAGHQYFEVQAVRFSDHAFDGQIILGFRHIDNLIAAEQKYQEELKAALEKERLSNEVLSAISKIYYAIFRIDLEQDLYEEISSDNEIHHLTGKRGCASAEMRELCNAFVVPEYRDKIMHFFDLSTLADRLAKEETIAAEYLATDGNWHTARFIVKRRNPDGRVTHVLYVTRLISDAKRREQNWIAIAEEANKANEAKTEFISQIAHDIRTPLNAILGFLTITEAQLDDPEMVKYGLERIRTSGEFLLELVNNVLDLSRIENGRMKLQTTSVELKPLFDELAPAFETMKKTVSFHYEFHEHDTKPVVADPLRLKQIFTNLLSNAMKYTPDGGDVYLEADAAPSSRADHVVLSALVRDTGIGMSEDYMKTMYSKFSRETDSRINKVSGYGLGLSIVKQLTDLMDGTIQVQSAVGQGTSFRLRFEFPIAAQKPEQTPCRMEQEREQLCTGMHLLVAEDNDLNYDVLAELLRMHGITCDRAADGAACIERFRSAPPHTYDAILMDMQMPVMNGPEAARTIRKLSTPEAHRIPILAMTANAFKEDINECLDAGMNLHLSKPVNMDRLLDALADFRSQPAESGDKS